MNYEDRTILEIVGMFILFCCCLIGFMIGGIQMNEIIEIERYCETCIDCDSCINMVDKDLTHPPLYNCKTIINKNTGMVTETCTTSKW